MKNQKALLVTVAVFLALICLSSSASQLPMDRRKMGTTRPSRLGEIKPRPRRVVPRLTKEQKIEMLDKNIELYEQRIDAFKKRIRDTRREIRNLKRQR